MILTIVRSHWRMLRRSPVELLVTFIVPIVFFSIFALVFGGQGADKASKVEVAVVDEAKNELSIRLVQALQEEAALEVRTTVDPKVQGSSPLDRDGARALVKDGKISVAIVLPKGLAIGFGPREGDKAAPVDLYYDASDQIAPQIVAGLLQKTTMTAAPDLMAAESSKWMETFSGGLTPEQKANVDKWTGDLKRWEAEKREAGSRPTAASGGFEGLVPVRSVDVLREGKNKGIIAFYAAGIAVMFLLFACSGAGGALIEEEESGTLERLLTTRLGMTRLLIGKWLFLTTMGIAEVVVMFVWGMLVFKLDLLGHLAGFATMTIVTASAAAAFGLVLATACRSRAQLSGISTIVILTMSAMGGSMFPRFLMTETMQKIGLCTFNAWALDGYVKVFWRDAAVLELAPQVGVLVGLSAVFLFVARLLARRWETI